MWSFFIILSSMTFALNRGHPASQNRCENYYKLRGNIQNVVAHIDKLWNTTHNELKQANCSPADLEQWKYYVQMLQGNYTNLSKGNRDLTLEVHRKPQHCSEAQFIINNTAVEPPLAELALVRLNISNTLSEFYAELNSDKNETDMNQAIQSFESNYLALRMKAQELMRQIRSTIKRKN